MSLPNMSNTLTGWFQRITFVKITKDILDGEVVETEKSESFEGVVQNLNSQQLSLKPEGQRAWIWKMIHCRPSLILNVDEIIQFSNVRYRVMQKKDYSEYGYIEYHITQDYVNG